jgi:hypothetical protein
MTILPGKPTGDKPLIFPSSKESDAEAVNHKLAGSEWAGSEDRALNDFRSSPYPPERQALSAKEIIAVPNHQPI